jgi:hypothetical protein
MGSDGNGVDWRHPVTGKVVATPLQHDMRQLLWLLFQSVACPSQFKALKQEHMMINGGGHREYDATLEIELYMAARAEVRALVRKAVLRHKRHMDPEDNELFEDVLFLACSADDVHVTGVEPGTSLDWGKYVAQNPDDQRALVVYPAPLRVGRVSADASEQLVAWMQSKRVVLVMPTKLAWLLKTLAAARNVWRLIRKHLNVEYEGWLCAHGVKPGESSVTLKRVWRDLFRHAMVFDMFKLIETMKADVARFVTDATALMAV